MRTSFWLAGTALMLLALGGCNKARSPADVQRDVTSAANSAAEKDAQANEKQGDVASAVNKDLGEAAQKADTKSADAAADTAVTQAEGKHEVATAKCESMSGDAQKACKEEADAALDMAKAKAKTAKADHS
jgi:hypothetical protein